MTDAYTPPPDPTAEVATNAASSIATSFLNFVKHPGTNTGLGLGLVALSQFTAAVPKSDRGSDSILGVAYAAAMVLIDRFSPKS